MQITHRKAFSSVFDYYDPIVEFTQHISSTSPNLIVLERAFYNIKELDAKIEKILTDKKLEYQTRATYVYVGNNSFKILQEKCYICRDFVLSFCTDVSNIREDLKYHEDDIESSNEVIKQIETLKSQLVSDRMRCHVSIAISHVHSVPIDEIITYIASKDTKAKKKENEIGIIVNTEYGLELENFNVRPTVLDLTLNYNDDFLEVSDRIVNSLNAENQGIILLHGEKGSGKTTYVRWLAKAIKDKKIIYVSPDLAEQISNPSFISFFIKYPDSILIIEDAETILKSRNAGGNQAVANLLNLSDGLLGDALKLQVICTFNASLTEIDDALKRPGRLIAEYKFGKLKQEKAQKLANKIFSEETIIDKDMTVAELYNMKKKQFTVKNDNQIGFKRNY